MCASVGMFYETEDCGLLGDAGMRVEEAEVAQWEVPGPGVLDTSLEMKWPLAGRGDKLFFQAHLATFWKLPLWLGNSEPSLFMENLGASPKNREPIVSKTADPSFFFFLRDCYSHVTNEGTEALRSRSHLYQVSRGRARAGI